MLIDFRRRLRRAPPAHTILMDTKHEEDVMPVLKFTNDEIGTLLHALRTEAGEWLRYKTFHGSAQNINSVSRILENVNALEGRVQEVYNNMTDEDDEEPINTQITEAEAKRRTAVAKMIIAEIEAAERVSSGKAPTENTPEPRGAWHRTHGWLHPVEHLKNAAADVEAGEITREEVAAAVGIDLDEVDAENARDRARQDQVSPGTWALLPEDIEALFDETDFDAELGDSRARGFTALLFQDFTAASDADVKNALALVRQRPSVITALKRNLDAIDTASAVVS